MFCRLQTLTNKRPMARPLGLEMVPRSLTYTLICLWQTVTWRYTVCSHRLFSFSEKAGINFGDDLKYRFKMLRYFWQFKIYYVPDSREEEHYWNKAIFSPSCLAVNDKTDSCGVMAYNSTYKDIVMHKTRWLPDIYSSMLYNLYLLRRVLPVGWLQFSSMSFRLATMATHTAKLAAEVRFDIQKDARSQFWNLLHNFYCLTYACHIRISVPYKQTRPMIMWFQISTSHLHFTGISAALLPIRLPNS